MVIVVLRWALGWQAYIDLNLVTDFVVIADKNIVSRTKKYYCLSQSKN